ncbi:MAG TPA: hypothetical protein VGQ42_15120 [Candidatus Dormibacteraeota bacterium]|nr:hypothetical protein [Candidatus Dormibacteraeota bacterium]
MVVLSLLSTLSATGLVVGATPTRADTPVPLPPVPDLPAPPTQVAPIPGAAAVACQFPPLTPTEIRSVFVDRHAEQDATALPDLPQIDPDNPCHIYRSLGGVGRAGGTSRLVRGDLEGGAMTWRTVFLPNQNVLASQGSVNSSETMTAVAVPRSGHVVGVTSDANGLSGGHVVASQDSGASWSSTTLGLPARVAPSGNLLVASPPPQTLLAIAPSDPRTEIVEYPGDDTLHLTSDGGQHWSRLPFAAAGFTVSDVQFDPADARHVFVVATSFGNTLTTVLLPSPTFSSLILESHDGGQSWAALPSLAGVNVQSLIVTTRAGGTLYAGAMGDDKETMTWQRSRDDGRSWSQVTPPTKGATLAADPRDPSTLVWVGHPSASQLVVMATTDDFTTTPVLVKTFTSPPGTTIVAKGSDGLPAGTGRGSLTADRHGDFFLSRTIRWDSNLVSDDLIAFRVSALAPPAASSTSSASASAPSSWAAPSPPGYQAPPPPPVSNVTAGATCTLPPVTLPANSNTTIYQAGSITFDGRYLDYAQEDLAPGVIFRVDTTCAPAPPLRLHPEDFPNGTLPILYELSYAADYRFPNGTVGAILATVPRNDPRLASTQTPVYAIDPTSARATMLLALSTVVSNTNRSRDTSPGVPLFAYDFFRGGLWTLGGEPLVEPGFQPIGGGPFQTNCMTDFANPDYGFRGGPNNQYVSTWTVGGDGITYVQLEDDQTVYRVDNRTCQVLGGFAHPVNSESTSENDQMACDAVSFGPGSAAAGGGPGHSVLWIRDSAPNSVSAYAIPDAYCPFPSRLTYTGVTTAAPGQGTPICFVLKSMSAGVQQPLANQPVHVTFNGADIGQGTTDAAGNVCRTTNVPAGAGTFLATARFAGNSAYLSSTAEGTLVVLPRLPYSSGGALTPPSGLGGLPAPGPGPGSPPNSVPVSEPAANISAQTEAQAQAQAQAQSQGQAQSMAQVQPGVMAQRQKQAQVATQQIRGVQTEYQARAFRRTQPGPIVVWAAGVLMLGFGVAARRVATARSRIRR